MEYTVTYIRSDALLEVIRFAGVRRAVEDIFDTLDDSIKEKTPQVTKDKFDARKEIRERKPS